MNKKKWPWIPALLLLGAAAAHAASFPVTRFVVEGNTLLDDAALVPHLESLLGNTRTLDDLLEARRRIEELYQNAGYSLVGVGLPRTIPADGTVRLQVAELAVREVTIAPAVDDSERYRRALPSLQEGESPNLLKLSRELNLANDNYSHAIAVDFAKKDDGVVAEIRIEEASPLKLTLTLDNTGTHETGRARSGIIVQHANVLGLDHQATFAYTTAPENPSKVSIAALYYNVPLPRLGDSLLFTAHYSNVDSGRVADFFNVSGQGSGYGAHYIHQFDRQADKRAAVDFGIERRIYRDIIDFSGEDLGTQIDALPATLQFNASGRQGRANYTATLGITRNLPGGRNNTDRDYALVRYGAAADWSVLRGSARGALALPDKSELSLRGEWQNTQRPLIPGEQFGLGGSRSVRGLVERETAGDRGWLASLEWQSRPLFEHHRLALFADRGHVSRLKTPSAPDDSASSWGVGWRFLGWKGLYMNFDFATVRRGAGQTDKGEHRGHFLAVWTL